MPISAIGTERWRSEAGLSLVEVLTALAVLAMMAGAVVLLAPGPDRELRHLAERVAARAMAAGEESVLTNKPITMVVSDQGYGFERFEDGSWRPLAPASPFGFRVWPDEVSVRGDEDVRFDPTGAATPAQVVIEARAARWAVAIDGGGRAHVSRLP